MVLIKDGFLIGGAEKYIINELNMMNKNIKNKKKLNIKVIFIIT